MIDFKAIFEYDRLAKEEGKKYQKRRFFYNEIVQTQGKHFTGILGARGVGKTILLKQLACEQPQSLYVSLDAVDVDLFELAKKAKEEFKIQSLLLDEVHFHPRFQENLKKIYDFLDIQVIFTSSIALALIESQYDLSRRVLLKKLYPFSFREYLYFKYDVEFPSLTFDQIIQKEVDSKFFSYSQNFSDYLQGGIFPFAIEEPFVLDLLKNVAAKVIRKDIPRVTDISVSEIEIIEKVLQFIGTSGIDGINYSSISQNCGITKYKAQQYVELLEKAFIIHQIFPKGTNVLKEPKILMAVPYRLLYTDFQRALGGLREDFLVEMMRSLGKEIYYLKSTRGQKTPDYLLTHQQKNVVVEVGGKGKGRQQFKGIVPDQKIIAADAVTFDELRRPLFLFGFLSDK
ncbi:MAG: ATP-binding protein [Candidatus Omnitrophica bacterium]|nr:ATP-binding protein [Candidatus Omnitrophota bacterium]MCB9747037.1 ATP-binding protein [Candidatus Omnitrophota bacterium]